MNKITKWQTVAPDREKIVIAMDAGGYINQEFKHGSFIHNELLANAYPQFFYPIVEDVQPKVKAEKVEVPTTEKKKGGRPKGSPNKRKVLNPAKRGSITSKQAKAAINSITQG
jgi:hypothetical protein